MVKRVCVYCASSPNLAETFLQSAYTLGKYFARAGVTTVYGCGGTGLMGSLADGVLDHGGDVVGIIPNFMVDREWAHQGVSNLIRVDSMHERKARMEKEADAFIILPGGCGTFEEAWEIITWKRLKLHVKPICIANLWNYYDPLVAQLDNAIADQFMRNEHRELFDVRESIEAVQDWVTQERT
ncbi:MAG: TIGR00730 family Rossman fold protein [Opitutaceae bacterium]|nr:TIGR00730 family Rossman fold protein [Opitutaceae bacterium]|tara:strand:- start:3315 stop:3863 length:549 start_codon:yes stop_codon:yes gene_type:complete